MVNLISFITFLSLSIYNIHADKKVVCYYGSWATYRNGNGQFNVEHIDPFICSHLMYSFVGLDYDYRSIRIMDQWLELPSGRDYFRKFTNLKRINPKLKTIAAIGGWNEGSARFSIMANDPNLRSEFVQNALKFVIEYGFDGLDVDWEYPNQRDSANGQKDVSAFTQLLAELKEQFSKNGLLITAAVAATEASASQSYDIPKIAQSLDFINLMTYDLHGSWDPFTGHNAGLYVSKGQVLVNNTVSKAVDYWLSQGVPSEKLVLGAPLYGRTFRLANAANNSVGAPSSGPGIAGQYTYQNGMIGYNEFCEKLLTENHWNLKWDTEALVPYAVSGNDWISYDNLESVKRKAEYANSKKLAGLMVWSMETDDFRGACGGRTFEVLRAINDALGNTVNAGAEPATERPVSTGGPVSTEGPVAPASTGAPDASGTDEPEVPAIPDGGPGSLCTDTGLFVRDPVDCSVFYLCAADVVGDLVAHKFQCPADLVFDTEHNYCNYRSEVQC